MSGRQDALHLQSRLQFPCVVHPKAASLSLPAGCPKIWALSRPNFSKGVLVLMSPPVFVCVHACVFCVCMCMCRCVCVCVCVGEGAGVQLDCIGLAPGVTRPAKAQEGTLPLLCW